MYRNNRNGTFTDVSSRWGISTPSNSNGAAYADLDNDGELDLVVNNINQNAFVYENLSNTLTDHHFPELRLNGGDANTRGIGAKVYCYTASNEQYLEQEPTQGFQSSVSPMLHFGLGAARIIDSLMIVWPRGRTQVLTQVNSLGRMHEASLPLQAQYAPVYAITSLDYDHDGKGDLLLRGNMNHARLRFGKYDANYGVLLHGDGKGAFTYVDQGQAGFNIQGDVRGVLKINNVLLFSMDKGLLKA